MLKIQGTAPFMAAEVLRGEYYFHAWHHRKSEEDVTENEEPHFVQNYLHDAESLWWVALFFLVYTNLAGQKYDTEHIADAYGCFLPRGHRDCSNPLYLSDTRRLKLCPEYAVCQRALHKWGTKLVKAYRESQP